MQTASASPMAIGYVTHLALLERGQKVPASPPTKTYTVPEEDEKLLRRFFKPKPMAGGGNSNFGAMLEKMAAYTMKLIPCTACGGIPAQRDPETGELLDEGTLGTGFATGAPAFKDFLELADTPRSREEIRAWLEEHSIGREMELSALDCRKCCSPRLAFRVRGGLVVRRNDPKRPPDVNITAEMAHVYTASVTSGTDEMIEFAEIMRPLKVIEMMDPNLALAFQLYYAPDGWSTAALWPCTYEAQVILAEQGEHESFSVMWDPMAPFKELRRQRDQNIKDKKRDPQLEERIKTLDREARAVRRRMGRVWHEVRK